VTERSSSPARPESVSTFVIWIRNENSISKNHSVATTRIVEIATLRESGVLTLTSPQQIDARSLWRRRSPES
jgi:hypothetical protein